MQISYPKKLDSYQLASLDRARTRTRARSRRYFFRTNRIFLFCLFLGLVGCHRQSPWVYQKMVSERPAFQSGKLGFAPSNHMGLSVEFIKSEKETEGFLIVYAGQIASNEGVIWVDNHPIYFKGTLMEGKQRLLLPKAITRDIIQALSYEQHVIASLQGYTVTLDPTSFKTQFQNFDEIR